ncbi:MAG: cell surface protein SprA [bacterium]|nr:cell surface protein SprA [bacterium]
MLLFGVFLATAPLPARADPDFGQPLLPGLDPLLRSTEEPRLLGVERLVLRTRLLRQGVDPLRHPGVRPGMETIIRRHWHERAGIDLERQVRLREYNGPLDLATEIAHPKFFNLLPAAEPLPGGFTWYPPRPVDDPSVDIFVDEIGNAMARRHAVAAQLTRTDALDLSGGGKETKDTSLLNLTIPVKLPRTLEKIIGKGEKTRIKITGREHIALSGESTVTKPFVPSERVTSQSLFPTLDMEQQLQINLSGTIGEKIILEVDHNSQQMGPEATKIKLMYRGLEDEIIKTIETGDVGLTLPGSTLLGYSSNKTGLFGLKVTGQVGRADFTAVASKQKAESSSKSFNAKGGQVSDNIIKSSDYLNNRFFKLDLPELEPSGRQAGERILLSSIKVFQLMPTGQPQPGEISNVAAYVDQQGFRAWGTVDFTVPAVYGPRWREITAYDTLRDSNGDLVAIDMRTRMDDSDVLAVAYTVIDANRAEVGSVGDNPDDTLPTQAFPGGEGNYYRLKLLKAVSTSTPLHVFRYVLRNIYSLGGTSIDPATFELRIERDEPGAAQPSQDENGIDYIRIFGLDRTNAQNAGRPDGQVDSGNDLLFDLGRGLLKFPLDFPEPFNATEAQYAAYADTTAFTWEGTFLQANVRGEFYDPETLPTNYHQYAKFNIVARHAAASSSFNLGASNIEEGSEVVTLDGRTLTRDVDYEIDYTFGEIQLKGDAANLTADSKIAVDYQYAPFLGGGNTSLMGLSLGYDLGRDSKLATTWLYQSESIVGEKAKLGEEPSRNLVGNVNVQHTLRPDFLTSLANFLSRNDSERESTVQLSAEIALSKPNPNTKGEVYLEDFEGVDASDVISLSRLGWSWASIPYLGAAWRVERADAREFTAPSRVPVVRWFLPKERVLRRYLNPDLVNQERDETQSTMDLYLRADGLWRPDNWGGIMRGISRTGLDLSKSQFVEVWVNDQEADPSRRSGRLHIDFGYINEDGFWPLDEFGNPVENSFQREDGSDGTTPDGVWTYNEDIGLDGDDSEVKHYRADYEYAGDAPFPRINLTARNNREDTEDLNANGILDRTDGYYTISIDLGTTEPLVDVVQDYDNVQDLIDGNIAWRKYRIPLAAVDSVAVGGSANLKAVTHVRVWYENDGPTPPTAVHLQLSELRFLGSRWEREGVRRVDGEILLSPAERLPGEEFFLGEVNNKENPDYSPPFAVHVENNIPDKEQSLVLNFEDLERGHLMRVSKQVSPRGDDYTGYRNMSWYWFNPSHDTADLDLLFRVGADSLNYYEVAYRFADDAVKTGWHRMSIGLAELSNAKNGVLGEDGVVRALVADLESEQQYRVRVVGRPDLRRVRRYYMAVANKELSQPASGYLYINDVRLEGVKREQGMARRAGVRLNMADVYKLDFDWKHTDDEFHGLDKRVGSGIDHEEWSLQSSLNVEDYMPLAGFRLPISGSRRQVIDRPKYVTNSDIEIIDADLLNAQSTIGTREQLSARLNHTPSKARLLRYLVDPWALQISGSRSEDEGPLLLSRSRSLQGALTFDLRIPGSYSLAAYPLVGRVPILRSVSLVPRKIALAANFSATEQASTTINDAGVATERPLDRRRTGRLTGGLDYAPLPVVDLAFNASSDRDLLREKRSLGVNIGEENRRAYDLRITFSTPKGVRIPDGLLFAPARAFIKGLDKVNPSLQFSGAFGDVHDPAMQQPGDPPDIRSVSNSANWDLRMSVPVGDVFKALFPERKYDDVQRNQMVAAQRRLEEQAARRLPGGPPPGPVPGQAGADSSATGAPADVPPGEELLTPEERQRREAERLLEAAEARIEEEREQERLAGDTQPGAGAGVSQPPAASGGRGFGPRTLVEPVLGMLRSTQPLKLTFTTRDQSSYARLLDKASFWYQAGFTGNLDVDPSRYASSSFDNQETISLSTSTKVTRSLSLDFKYGRTDSRREQVGSESRNLREDWPDVTLSLSGIEKWRLLGGGRQEGDGWLRSSSLNVGYKRGLTVNNYTATVYNPTISTALQPRWSFTFPSGLSATLNANLKWDDTRGNGVQTKASQTRYGLQVRHQFRAERFLAKLGLYKPGASQNVTMDVDVSYQSDRTDRINPGLAATAPTGTRRMSLEPRFTYQISRNLTGALRFKFARSANIATDQTQTTLGLGVEATFVF